MRRVVIIGGGIAGLATALHLRDRADRVPGGVEVRVLEARDRPGGNIRTERLDGFTIEAGPNGFLDNAPATLDLVRRLGLESRLQRADESAARRFLFHRGRLHELPTGPATFLRSPVLSLRGRLRVFAEPLAGRRPEGVDESIYDFAARRIGAEAAAILVDAMVSGVFAGDVRALSLRSSFPRMHRMEEEHGGLVRALLARTRERRAARREAARRSDALDGGEHRVETTRPGGPAGPGGTLTSFREGLDEWIDALSTELVDELRTGTAATGIAAAAGSGEGRWDVRTRDGSSLAADAVVVAVPSPRAVSLLEPLDPELAGAVGAIETAGLAVVALGFRSADTGPVQGFGFLVPRGTGPRILGCLWDSSIFPGRAPADHVLLRAMIGGAHDPAAVNAEDEVLVDQVLRDLRTTMGLVAKPVLVRIFRWPLGIGQYTVGHQDRLDRIHTRLSANPGLWVAGSSYYGISMNACIEHAPRQVEEILRYLT